MGENICNIELGKNFFGEDVKSTNYKSKINNKQDIILKLITSTL